ncbi:hypothetical protein OIU83_12840 [Flavobacterium sp. LS1R49]|uniref:Uncharacterized protein n=1 Tax=Flavobacterium shii TaxID=2987687 RepID=A0A9X2ZH37_9FLAO|nr:hypothetical protein [Flavobacterium shii]MCV9928547.1 hypothetical protein [Flavobacterium shii]
MKTNSTQPSINFKSNNLFQDTSIDTPEGIKSIDNICKGDTVLAAFVKSAKGKIKLFWSTAKVSFSIDSNPISPKSKMVYISVYDEIKKDILCSLDQPVLLANGKYTIARRLIPGQELVNKNGKPIVILSTNIAPYHGGVHHISTNSTWNNNPDGHLLLSNGIVTGDYILQLYFDQIPNQLIEERF